MRIFLFITSLVSPVFYSSGQVIGTLFPNMETYTAKNTMVRLPQDVQKKYTLLILSDSKRAEKELKGWFEPIFYKFVQKATGIMEGLGYDVYVYFVSIFTGANRAVMKKAQHLAMKKIDPRILDLALFYNGKFSLYRKQLGFNKNAFTYIFVLNPEGKIVSAVSGVYKESKMDAIEEVIE